MDTSTIEVMEWIDFHGGNVVRINSFDDPEVNISLILSKDKFCGSINLKERSIATHEIGAMWFRRTNPDNLNFISPNKDIIYDLAYTFNKNNQNEYNAYRSSFYSALSDRYWLGHPNKTHINKTHQLYYASKIGLNIPNTIITKSRAEAINMATDKKVILKPLYNIQTYRSADYTSTYFNKIVSIEYLSSSDAYFYPSCFQEYIEKDFEIRTFYLEKECYSMVV